jgi:putative ABC transport system ATP-binding protein
MINPLIECQNLGKEYLHNKQRFSAITDLNLRIEPSTVILIKGRSGAGKSTLLNLICGLIKPTSGKVLYKGQSISHMNNETLSKLLLNDFGIIFQSFNLLPTYTVFENIEVAVAPGGKDQTEIKNKIRQYLEIFGLDGKAALLPAELSVGQQQKIALIRTLIKQPAVIFADEPTGSVDEESSTEILEYLIKLKKENNLTLIMASHGNIPDRYAERIIELENGRIKI